MSQNQSKEINYLKELYGRQIFQIHKVRWRTMKKIDEDGYSKRDQLLLILKILGWTSEQIVDASKSIPTTRQGVNFVLRKLMVDHNIADMINGDKETDDERF